MSLSGRRILAIRPPSDQHERLKTLAAHRGVSWNKLFEEFFTKALAEFDTEIRFHARAAAGSPARGLQLLDQLDRHHGDQAE